jgi:archaetidylinositol phosphate synthase
MLGPYLRKYLAKNDPFLKFCSRIKIHPNRISVFSLLPAMLAACFIVNKLYLPAAMLAAASLMLDVLDGACARMNSSASRLGSYIDALVDRYREIIFYSGFALAGFPLEAFFALSGSLLISFAKARTAMSVSIDNHDWPAIGDMADRNTVLILGLLVASLKPVWFLKYNFLSFVLVTIGLLAHTGCICRLIYAKKIIKKALNM